MDADSRSARRGWAYETFGDLSVGSRARTTRVVSMATALAARPAGAVTEVFDTSAEREGAYRLLANDAVSSKSLGEAVFVSGVARCAKEKRVFVPVDGSSLTLTDKCHARDIGGVGAWAVGARGLIVQTALAVAGDGTTIGLVGQSWWARTGRSEATSSSKTDQTETRHGLQVIRRVRERFIEDGSGVEPIFLLDRGYDCWPILRLGVEGFQFTVRAQYSRRLADGPRGEKRYLIDELEGSRARGEYSLELPARPDRPARVARMRVRARPVTVILKVGAKRRETVKLNAVLATEVRGPKTGSLRWMLLTTSPIDTLEQVIDVVDGYTYRWRIEEFHRTWKSGGCNVEDTQLRSREAIQKWATIHAAVAARAVRLAQLARTRPDLPATEEFTQPEIDAAILLKKGRTKYKRGSQPPLGDMVRMVADLGGYTGKSSGGPPGPTVVARGLERVAVAAEILEMLGR